MSFKFGLSVQKKGSISKAKKPAAAFGFGQDDDDDDVGVDATSGPKANSKKPKNFSQYGDISSQKSFKKNVKKALEVDSTIYDYDGAWEAIKSKENAKKAEDKAKLEEGKPKYMENLLAAQEVRNKDIARAKEKKYQRERDAEGDEYRDKEKFVTGAYKKHQAELLKQEEAEKKKQEEEEKLRGNHGKRDFMNRLLEQDDRRHQEDVTAAESHQANPTKTDDTEQKTEVQIARELNAKGANIAITDDGEIADHRDLLSAGLNTFGKTPKPVKQRPNPSSNSRSSNYKRNPGSRADASRSMEDELLAQLLKRQADDDSDAIREEEHNSKRR